MAFLSIQQTRASIAERVTAYIDQKVEDMQRARVFRTTMTELSALSDRELQDLGISRFDIPRVAREAAETA